MKIKTTLLGELEFEEKDIFYFPEGIPAFKEEKQFLIIAMGEGAPFYYMQSAANPDLCLVLAEPFMFFPDYGIEVGDEELDKLECQNRREDLLVYVILTVPEDFKESTANLLAPIIVNQEKKRGIQFVAVNSEYKTKHPIFPREQAEIAATSGEG